MGRGGEEGSSDDRITEWCSVADADSVPHKHGTPFWLGICEYRCGDSVSYGFLEEAGLQRVLMRGCCRRSDPDVRLLRDRDRFTCDFLHPRLRYKKPRDISMFKF